MNRSFFAFFVALLIHILLIILFWFLMSITPEFKKPQKENKIKISLKEIPLKKAPDVVPQYKDTIKEDIFNTKNKKVILEKKLKDIQHNILSNNKAISKGSQLKELTNLSNSENIKKIKKTMPKTQKTDTPSVKKEKSKNSVELDKKNPFSWAYEDKSFQEEQEEKKGKNGKKSIINSVGKEIEELYGVDWDELSEVQHKYILNNATVMRNITQEVLNRQARVSLVYDLRVNKENIVEFYLNPDGNISDFKFLKKSGYFMLDDVTKATIEYAFSKYPRPPEKTLIRYHFLYNLK